VNKSEMSALAAWYQVIPETGEVLYQDAQRPIRATNQHALGMFHPLRRAGHIAARLEKREGGGVNLYISRGKPEVTNG
jgi:hypothetical protein